MIKGLFYDITQNMANSDMAFLNTLGALRRNNNRKITLIFKFAAGFAAEHDRKQALLLRLLHSF